MLPAKGNSDVLAFGETSIEKEMLSQNSSSVLVHLNDDFTSVKKTYFPNFAYSAPVIHLIETIPHGYYFHTNFI